MVDKEIQKSIKSSGKQISLKTVQKLSLKNLTSTICQARSPIPKMFLSKNNKISFLRSSLLGMLILLWIILPKMLRRLIRRVIFR